MTSNTNHTQRLNTQPQQPQEKAEKIWVESTPIPFDEHSQSMFITSEQLGRLVNKYFKSILVDYEGCYITPLFYQNREPGISIIPYLTKKNNGESEDGRIISLIDNTAREQSNATGFERVRKLNNQLKSKQYSIHQDTKDLFSTFSYEQTWNENKSAVLVTDKYPQGFTYATVQTVQIKDLDPVKILRKIYGTKVNGEEYDYRASVLKHGPAGNGSLIIRIDRINKENLHLFSQEVGYRQAAPDSIPMYHVSDY